MGAHEKTHLKVMGNQDLKNKNKPVGAELIMSCWRKSQTVDYVGK